MSTLNTFSTETFPYTIGYVCELLSLNDTEVNHYARLLGIAQQRDERSGKLIFFHRDVEVLKRAVEMVRAGEDIQEIANRLSVAPTTPHSSVAHTGAEHPEAASYDPSGYAYQQGGGHLRTESYESVPRGGSAYSSAEVKPISAHISPTPISPSVATSQATAMQGTQSTGFSALSQHPSRDSLTVMVETVSQVKEGIIKDLSRMLDDKLSGLDEVVVQLIRSQSENESLKKRLEELERSKGELEQELSSFKPVQFGFYKKTR
ncbi:MAG: hypothetical protein VKJ04_11210 [Vampirovibrionales bacterium]|nr:hypothetical protein [Vampirovibrionales bacterium]